jgi:hypothetical protein
MTKYSTIAAFLADQDPVKLEQINLLRTIITGAHPGLAS